jgi:predicted alpha/beta-fold hydrolase
LLCAEALPIEAISENPLAILAVTKTGGHGGWCMGLWPTGLSWVELVCAQYIDAHLELNRDCQPAGSAE